MKQRNVVAVICFSILTLGIYDLFWLHSTKKELNARTKEHVPTLWLLFSPFLILLLSIIIDMVGGMSGGAAANLIGILLSIVGFLALIIVSLVWFLKYSKAVNEYTNGEINTAVSFILLWCLHLIGVAVIQDKFNDMIAAGAVPSGPVAPVSPMGPAPTVPAQVPMQPPTPAPVAPQPVNPAMPPQTMQHPTVDPTDQQSYGQQQPPTPPSGPLVQ